MLSLKKTTCIIKKIMSGIFWAILLFFLIIALWMTIDKYIRKSPVPSFCGYAGLTIISGSMSGTIEIDDLIIIKDCDEYKNGDIITFMKEGDKAPTTHRINFIYDGDVITYRTKGDANGSNDAEYVYKEEILGKVVLVIPDYAKFTRWITKEGGWLYIASAILIFMLGKIILKSDNGDKTAAETDESGETSSTDKPLKSDLEKKATSSAEPLPESNPQTNQENPASVDEEKNTADGE